jgi:hypothetical protein
LEELRVLRVKANWKEGGPPKAFELLEAKLPTLKGRKFYGCFRAMTEVEEYYACVGRIESDDPDRMQLEAGVIPGGWYVREKLMDWEKNIPEIGRRFREMERGNEVDSSRPSIEFYRSRGEVLLFLPVRKEASKTTQKS